MKLLIKREIFFICENKGRRIKQGFCQLPTVTLDLKTSLDVDEMALCHTLGDSLHASPFNSLSP